jgi:hypothetical protein
VGEGVIVATINTSKEKQKQIAKYGRESILRSVV